MVQDLVTPNFSRAAINAVCRYLVKNSDRVIPDPFNFVFENHKPSRMEVLHSLRSIGLGFLLEDCLPILWHLLTSAGVKDSRRCCLTTSATTRIVSSWFCSFIPCRSNIFLRLRISALSTSRASVSSCFEKDFKVWNVYLSLKLLKITFNLYLKLLFNF